MSKRRIMQLYLRRWRRSHASRIAIVTLVTAAAACWATPAFSEEQSSGSRDRPDFRSEIEPILAMYCYDCHGNGAEEGDLALDQFKTSAEALAQPDLWWRVLKNLRAGIMPPAGSAKPNGQAIDAIERWVILGPFNIDPDNVDPGSVTVNRLNREQYGNTIRDLVGVEFNTEIEFPPDDTGYGFDNIADVLSVSPLLLEKYVRAASAIVDEAVPKSSRVRPEFVVAGETFRSADGRQTGDRISFYDAAVLNSSVHLKHDGEYELQFTIHVDGEFAFDPGRCVGIFSVDGEEVARDEFIYAFSDDPDRGATFRYNVDRVLKAGEHRLSVEVKPLVPVEERLNRLDLRVTSVAVRGPADEQHWVQPPGYTRFFPEGPPPDDPAQRRDYAARILKDFGLRAFRRPLSEPMLERLVDFAAETFQQPDRSFEEGIASAMVVVLASPRFLFRVEADDPNLTTGTFPYVDEWSLASRLSYFFWSSMPDEDLFQLAAEGRLREQLPEQIARMLNDPRSAALVRNFTGQWLQVRNIDHTPIEPLAVLGYQEELDAIHEKFGSRLFDGSDSREDSELEAARARTRELHKLAGRFNPQLRESMRRETEMVFDYVLRENRSVKEFLNSDYTFLNQQLAGHYGIDGVEGDRMRRYQLPVDSPRGGVLTQGNMLLVTSNPTRTSPVKRGLFILENILGTPTPPAPPDIPQLEEAARDIADNDPPLRELLARHREDALCSSCHSRIDPLGLAFENFTALGTWRDAESGQPIDPAGELITGESFQGVRELKSILADRHRVLFYRCLTEKLMTYALGRGLEYYDEYTIDQIVERLEQQDGRFLALIEGIVESAPFQKRRKTELLKVGSTSGSPESQRPQTQD